MPSAVLLKRIPYVLLGGSIIGLVASFSLTVDKMRVLEDPTYVPGCSLSPILSCSSVLETEQASLFGIPNSLYGLVAFAALLTVSLLLVANTHLNRRIWLAMQTAAALGVIFMHYLFFTAVFSLHAICPWCFTVWMATIPIFWYITVYNLQAGSLRLPFRQFILNHHGKILAVWYAAIFMILLQHFWYYWETLL